MPENLSFFPTIRMLEIFLVENIEQLREKGLFHNYEPPAMGSSLAKTCYVENVTTGHEAIIVFYPNMLKDTFVQVNKVLVHEAVHCWDFNKDSTGYHNDSELNAYAIESIYTNLYNIYTEFKKEAAEVRRNAKRA